MCQLIAPVVVWTYLRGMGAGGFALWLALCAALGAAPGAAGGAGRSPLRAPAAFQLESTLQLNDAARADREVGYKLRARLLVAARWAAHAELLLHFRVSIRAARHTVRSYRAARVCILSELSSFT